MDAQRFVPARAFIEEAALSYPLGELIRNRLRDLGVLATVMRRGQRPAVPGVNPSQVYAEAKKTLVVRVRKEKGFSSCRPSAHYQLPLVTSCPGLCQYCYLQTTLGPRPYIRVYANIEEILAEAKRLVQEREGQVTLFEGSATSDPLPLEHITGSLRRAIDFFGGLEDSGFRFVTKFADIEPILGADHRGRTTVRFSVNAAHVLRYEHGTAPLERRLWALSKVAGDGYHSGLMIGPVIIFDGWKDEYRDLLDKVKSALGGTEGVGRGIGFEVITHRFTSRAKKSILSVFPNTTLPMEEGDRRLVHGQFGYTKYVYPKETVEEVREFFETEIRERLPGAVIQYIV
ncbi:MAG: spore photoproduct lyase [Bacillota bacterium]